ncbi:hypothetical protein [Clostridium beijerinckii]|uniref:hypothetical protein n=1 Tax=Clostridium beijerinckii TaxID=1520 RepID=UPI00047D98D1|nr:hypothetical protein [Clostridium beijerinckii]
MKKFIIIFSIFLFLSFTMNTINVMAQPKTFSQGFYTMKDLGLIENVNYIVQNNEPYAEGLLFIIDSDKKVQQLVRIQPSSTRNPLIPLKADYKFIIYGNVLLAFKQVNIS